MSDPKKQAAQARPLTDEEAAQASGGAFLPQIGDRFENGPRKCPKCDEQFWMADEYNTHLRKHLQKP